MTDLWGFLLQTLTASGAAALLQCAETGRPGDFEMVENIGAGYAVPNPEDTPYIQSLAREEGILLDPVYTGKAYAAMDEAGRKAVNDGLNAWLRTMRGNYKALCALWAAEDYDAMVKLMEGASDPGPISGDKPGKEEN